MTRTLGATIGGCVDLDLRFVRFFVVVAIHENFGRAAAELRIAQPTLSRYIQRLEQQMGVRLFDRSSQGTRLTDAGRAFQLRAEALLADADRAVTVARAATSTGALTVGYVGGLIITPAVRHLRRRLPWVDIRTVHLHWSDAHTSLLAHRTDVVVTRSPVPSAGLRLAALYEEPRVLLVPRGHRLAERSFVALDDFADEPLVGYDDVEYDAFWRIDPRPDGSHPPPGPIADVTHDKLESVAGGDALALAPADARNAAPRSDLVAIPVEGIAWSAVVLATRRGDNNSLIREFADSARSQLTAAGSVVSDKADGDL